MTDFNSAARENFSFQDYSPREGIEGVELIELKRFNDDGGTSAGKAYLILGASLGADAEIDLSDADYAFIGEAAADYARTPGYKHDALLLLSRAHRSLGMADEAVRRAEQAAALVLDDAAAHYEVAMCLAQRLARS